MKNRALFFGFLMLFITLTGCSVIQGIFKAGVWTGIIVVVIVVGLIIFLISKAKK